MALPKNQHEQYVYGIHSVKSLLLHTQRLTQKIWINSDRCDHKIQELEELAYTLKIAVKKVPAITMKQLFGEYAHQGVVAMTNALPSWNEQDLQSLLDDSKQPCVILILDGITDPHNLGACLRNADAAGVDFVIIPKDKNAQLTPVVSKIACGAVECIPVVVVTNLARTIELLKQSGVWIFGADSEATAVLYAMDFSVNTAIVVGGEGIGLRRLTSAKCDKLFALPMLGSVASLNVSVATGVILYEIIRQRIKY
ncbi:MAG: 23S rRNA (guanosine(2251)-2'-O)-methyltransferase RlmB [Legionellales bacterium RIFCSPHIGHO2_12_FULL_42_9]|nr:MAG: 23S rRNA (guanosine(2251)-2'-O)-methyltransferase RlmB [Legionellales bacterium RIFCSPHIGHO2_12_FULL_42_9]